MKGKEEREGEGRRRKGRGGEGKGHEPPTIWRKFTPMFKRSLQRVNLTEF